MVDPVLGKESQLATVSEEKRAEYIVRAIKERFHSVEIHGRQRFIIENRHPVRTAVEAGRLGKILGVKDLDEFKACAALHDVGKWHEDTIPLMRLLRGKKYSDEQRMIVRVSHTKLGPEMIDLLGKEVGFRGLPVNPERAKELCLYHHPEIDVDRAKRPVEIKILAVVDKFDAMTSGEDERSHRKRPYSVAEAAQELIALADQSFLDREIVQIFIESKL